MKEDKINKSVEDIYKKSLNQKDLEVLNSLKAEPVYIESNYYAANLQKMGFEIIEKGNEISFENENLKTHNKDYVIIKKDGKFGLASLVSSDILLICEYDEIKKTHMFSFKALILTKNEYKYIYNIEKNVIISKIEADAIEDCINGANVIISLNDKLGIYNIARNSYVIGLAEYDDVLYYDDNVIALLKENVVYVYDYNENKMTMQYKASSEEYYIEDKEKSSLNVFVINKNGKFGLIDILTGEFLVMPEYDVIEFIECFGKNNVAYVENENKCGIYNVTLKKYILNCVCDSILLSRAKLRNYIFSFKIGEKYGICTDKKVITNACFDSIFVPDVKGAYIICKTKQKIYVYNNDKYLLSLDNNDKFEIVSTENRKGIFIGTRFNDKKLICMHIYNRNAIMDKIINYNVVYELEDDNGYIFKEEQNKFYVYKRNSDEIFEKILTGDYFESIEKLNDNIFLYIKDEKYGLIDNLGNIITENIYDKILINSFGVIECQKDGLKGYYDDKIHKVSLSVYDEIIRIDNDIIAYKNGKCGIIDFNRVLVPFDYERIIKIDNNMYGNIKDMFDSLYETENPKYLVREKGKYAVLNDNGFIMSDYKSISNIKEILN